jgi:hypothetical protein
LLGSKVLAGNCSTQSQSRDFALEPDTDPHPVSLGWARLKLHFESASPFAQQAAQPDRTGSWRAIYRSLEGRKAISTPGGSFSIHLVSSPLNH